MLDWPPTTTAAILSRSASGSRELPLDPRLDLRRGETAKFLMRPWEIRQRIDVGAQPVSTSAKRELSRLVPSQRKWREACTAARSQLLRLHAGEALAQSLVLYSETADCLCITPRVGIARHVLQDNFLCQVAPTASVGRSQVPVIAPIAARRLGSLPSVPGEEIDSQRADRAEIARQ